MHTLVRTVFSKLHHLDPEEEEAKLLATNDDDAAEIELRMSVTTKESHPGEDEPPVDAESAAPAENEQEEKEPVNTSAEDPVPQTPISLINRPECMFRLGAFDKY